jgi:hypothetical protein
MGFLDWFRREKRLIDYGPEELRREEGRLQIRENQLIAKIEKTEAEREVLFRQGFEIKSPVRRRLLARKYEERVAEIGRLERDLSRLAKEAMTVSAIRYRLERRAQGESGILKKIGGSEIEDLREFFERDDIDEQMYAEKLGEVLGAVEEAAGDPLEGLGSGARTVLDIWSRMDDGVIETVEDGLEEARGRAEDERAEEEA